MVYAISNQTSCKYIGRCYATYLWIYILPILQGHNESKLVIQPGNPGNYILRMAALSSHSHILHINDDFINSTRLGRELFES